TVTQIKNLLQAGLSSDEIAFVLPCATGAAPDLRPCPELMTALRMRLNRLDAHIDTLVHFRQTLSGYIHAANGHASAQDREDSCGTPERASRHRPLASGDVLLRPLTASRRVG